ncbi:MAG: hypothetical protein V1799_16400 [bacterium]
MKNKLIDTVLVLVYITALFSIGFSFSSCVSSELALQMETSVNCPLMKNLQDNDEDLFQIEDGIGAVGEASACPT